MHLRGQSSVLLASNEQIAIHPHQSSQRSDLPLKVIDATSSAQPQP